MNSNKKVRSAGLLLLAGMLSGIMSVAPAIDSVQYLTAAADHDDQTTLAALAQVAMSLAYAGFAILLYPVIKRFGNSLSIGFLSFRMIAASLSIAGTALLLSLLALSREYVQHPQHDELQLQVLGQVLKASRDYTNHVFMILTLCAGNGMLYALLLKSKLLPGWLSLWGIAGALLSVSACMLLLFQKVTVPSWEYLALNAPTAVQELVLGIWLIAKGFDKKKTVLPR